MHQQREQLSDCFIVTLKCLLGYWRQHCLSGNELSAITHTVINANCIVVAAIELHFTSVPVPFTSRFRYKWASSSEQR